MQFSFVVDSRSDFAICFLFGGMSDDLIRLGIASLSRYVIIRDKAFVVDDDTEKSRSKADEKRKLFLPSQHLFRLVFRVESFSRILIRQQVVFLILGHAGLSPSGGSFA